MGSAGGGRDYHPNKSFSTLLLLFSFCNITQLIITPYSNTNVFGSLENITSLLSAHKWHSLTPEDVVTNRTIIILKPSKPHNNSKPLRNNILSITQINLKKKQNAWGTLLTNIQGRRNPIILASEPYTNDKNHIPHVHKDPTLYYKKKGTSKPRAAILILKTLDNKCCELTQLTRPGSINNKARLQGNHHGIILYGW